MNISLLQRKDNLEEIKEAAEELLERPVRDFVRLKGGLNSRIYKLEIDSKFYVLKFYFKKDGLGSKRLYQEFEGLRFLWENGFRDIPEPCRMNNALSCAAYGFVDGSAIAVSELDSKDIDQAIHFVKKLKEVSLRNDSKKLPLASEASFSIEGIVDNLHNRLNRLLSAHEKKREYQGKKTYLEDDFSPFLKEVTAWGRKKATQGDIPWDNPIPDSDKALSPSDFGFHNALRLKDGKIVFLDFEHFGWDDPAKMVADFLLHPAMNLREDLKKEFFVKILKVFPENTQLKKRVEVVYPLFALKWCLIFLNEFIASDFNRREFAYQDTLDRGDLLNQQLGKAKAMLEKIKADYKEFPYGR